MIRILIAAHLIGWWVVMVWEGYTLAHGCSTGTPIPKASERLCSMVELFFWEFTLVPTLVGSVIATLQIQLKEKR